MMVIELFEVNNFDRDMLLFVGSRGRLLALGFAVGKYFDSGFNGSMDHICLKLLKLV